VVEVDAHTVYKLIVEVDNMAVHVASLTYFILGSLGSGLSLVVIVLLWRLGVISSYSRLVLYLQLSVLLQEISSYPFLFSKPIQLCIFAAAFKQYFTLFNLIVNYFLSYYTYTIIFTGSTSKFKLSTAVQMYIFLIPLIMLLPISTGSFGLVDNKWCSFKQDVAGTSWNGSLLAVQLAVNLFALSVNWCILWRLSRHRAENTWTIFRVIRGSTFYCIVTVACWAPKIGSLHFNSNSDTEDGLSFSRLFTFVCGALYFAIYLLERDVMHSFELDVSGVDNLLATTEYGEHTTTSSGFARSTEIDLSAISRSEAHPANNHGKRSSRARDASMNAAFSYAEDFEY
jgi:hypothetical protein